MKQQLGCRLNKDMISLSSMMHKFADFDLEGNALNVLRVAGSLCLPGVILALAQYPHSPLHLPLLSCTPCHHNIFNQPLLLHCGFDHHRLLDVSWIDHILVFLQAGKRIFLQQMDDFVERFRIFSTRLRLTDDPVAQGMVRQLNVQLLEANVNLDNMYQGCVSETQEQSPELHLPLRLPLPACLPVVSTAGRK